jgi:hypothetical protein
MNVAVCGLGSRERGAPTQVTGINRTTTLPLRVSVCVECHLSCLCLRGVPSPEGARRVGGSQLARWHRGPLWARAYLVTRYTLFLYIFYILVFTFIQARQRHQTK